MAYEFDFSPINSYDSSRELLSGPRTTHCADFKTTLKGREYWGTVYRLFDRDSKALNRVSYSVSLRTRNARTTCVVALPENAKAVLRAAAVEKFKGLLSDWIDAGRPSTYEQRKAQLAKAEAREAVATYEALADQLGDPRHIANAREHREAIEDPKGVFDIEATRCGIDQVRDLIADQDSETAFRRGKELIAGFEARAAQLLAMKRLAYGDRFATAAEAQIQQDDPLAWIELIEEYLIAETGVTRRGWAASDLDLAEARAEIAAEQLAQKADANRCPDRAPDVAQLVAAAKSARFALESACYLQGLKALAPAALALTEALAAFEPVEDQAEAQMRAAAISGRSDLAA